MIAYLDTSALVKRYVAEPGSSWVRAITDPASGNQIAIGNITRVEIGAAVARRQRDPRNQMSIADRNALIALFDYHVAHEYLVVDILPAIVDEAYRLTQLHQLRGYDAIQLAAAKSLNAQLVAAGLPALTLISSDHELLAAARAEGLAVDDPHLHP
jgi:predicted nucleic acid-binding protein